MPVGRSGSAIPARARRTASDTAGDRLGLPDQPAGRARPPSAAACRSRPRAAGPAGMPVQDETTSATSSGPTSSLTIGAPRDGRLLAVSRAPIAASLGGCVEASASSASSAGSAPYMQPGGGFEVGVALRALGLPAQVVEPLLRARRPCSGLPSPCSQRAISAVSCSWRSARSARSRSQPLLAGRVGLLRPAPSPPSSAGRRCAAARRSRPAASRSPSGAGTRPRRPGRWPCPAGTAR